MTKLSVVTGRQQLYCAVQSQSPSHCQTTTRKVRSSARDGTSSATVHSWQTTAGCSTYVPKPMGRHGHWVLMSGGRYHQHGWVSRAQTTSSVDVRCPVQALSKVRRRCSIKTAVGQNAQPECDSLRNSQPWSSRSNGVMCSDRLAEKTKRAAAFKTDCSRSCSWPAIPARTKLQ